MSVAQVTINWTGFTGAPGTTTLNFNAGSLDPTVGGDLVAAADTFASQVAAVLGTGMNLTVDSEVKWFNPGTGVLEGFTGVDPAPSSHPGGGGALGSGASGAVISLGTAGVHNGRRVRGKVFVVPLAAAYYQSDGTLTTTAVTALTSYAVDLIADSSERWAVWCRPVAGAGGAIFDVTNARVPDMAAVLRSRRD